MELKKIQYLFTFLACCCCTFGIENENYNPPADGFDLANSDPAAVELADSIMAALGGRKNWDNTQFIAWNSGDRYLVWDKHKKRARIEFKQDSLIYLLDLGAPKGRVQHNGNEITNPESLSDHLQQAMKYWKCDLYALVMPFRLKDNGVSLKYLGEDTLSNGIRSNVLQVNFRGQNGSLTHKFLVYVDLKDNRIKQWAFYADPKQDSATFIRSWDNYKKYGNIYLSADRSDNDGPRHVKVYSSLPDKWFTEF